MQQGDDVRAVLGSDSNSDCFHLFAPPLWLYMNTTLRPTIAKIVPFVECPVLVHLGIHIPANQWHGAESYSPGTSPRPPKNCRFQAAIRSLRFVRGILALLIIDNPLAPMDPAAYTCGLGTESPSESTRAFSHRASGSMLTSLMMASRTETYLSHILSANKPPTGLTSKYPCFTFRRGFTKVGNLEALPHCLRASKCTSMQCLGMSTRPTCCFAWMH
jgi:hypothetical protein